MTSSNLVDCTTGKSVGLAPENLLPELPCRSLDVLLVFEHTKRREFITLLGGGPLAARAANTASHPPEIR